VITIIVIWSLPKAKSKKVFKCDFCESNAIWVRSPVEKWIEIYANADMTLSEAEMKVTRTCKDCMPIAGGFRTTTWSKL
jgi:hypothetical protein